MAHDITDLWTVLRLENIGGGFTADPDWVATNDVATFEANAKPHWYTANNGLAAAGLELALVFGNPPLTPIAALSTTTVSLEIVQVVNLRNVVGADFLHRFKSGITLTGHDVWRLPEPIGAANRFGIRLTAAANLPGGASRLAVIGRLI